MATRRFRQDGRCVFLRIMCQKRRVTLSALKEMVSLLYYRIIVCKGRTRVMARPAFLKPKIRKNIFFTFLNRTLFFRSVPAAPPRSYKIMRRCVGSDITVAQPICFAISCAPVGIFSGADLQSQRKVSKGALLFFSYPPHHVSPSAFCVPCVLLRACVRLHMCAGI